MVMFLDGLVAVFLAWWGYIGFRRGFIEELSRLAGIVAAYIIAQSYTGPLVLRLRNIFPLDSWILVMAGSAILFTLTLVCVRFVAQFLHQFVVTRSSRIVDRALGFSFGLIKGSILVMLTVWGLSISPLKEWGAIMKQSSGFISTLTRIGDRSFSALGIDDSLSDIQSIFPIGEKGPQDK